MIHLLFYCLLLLAYWITNVVAPGDDGSGVGYSYWEEIISEHLVSDLLRGR